MDTMMCHLCGLEEIQVKGEECQLCKDDPYRNDSCNGCGCRIGYADGMGYCDDCPSSEDGNYYG